MSTLNSNLIEKVRKILKRTEQAGCAQAESEAAYSMASRLMAEHNLSMSEIEAGVDDAGWREDQAYETGRWTLDQQLTYGIVTEFFFVKGFIKEYRADSGKVRKKLLLFGRPDNVEVACWTFQSLMASYDRLWDGYRIRSRAPASDRRVFVAGVASGFRGKLADERRVMEVERDIIKGSTATQGTALALVSIKQETEKAFTEAHSDMKSGNARFASVGGSSSALEAGQRAGRSLNLNRGIGGNSNKGTAKQ